MRLQRVKSGLPLISHLEGSTGFGGFLGTRGATGKSCGSGIVCVDNIYCVALVVLLYAHEGVVAEDGGSSSKLQIELVGNCSDEVVHRLVDLVRRGIRRGGAAKSVKLVELECRLLLVASPSEKLVRASYGGNVKG